MPSLPTVNSSSPPLIRVPKSVRFRMLKVAFPVKAKETADEASPPARLFKFLIESIWLELKPRTLELLTPRLNSLSPVEIPVEIPLRE